MHKRTGRLTGGPAGGPDALVAGRDNRLRIVPRMGGRIPRRSYGSVPNHDAARPLVAGPLRRTPTLVRSHSKLLAHARSREPRTCLNSRRSLMAGPPERHPRTDRTSIHCG
jgi:hypothetical protein